MTAYLKLCVKTIRDELVKEESDTAFSFKNKKNNLRVSNARILGICTDIVSSQSILLDDGTGLIYIKFNPNTLNIDEIIPGNLIDCIGKLQEFNEAIHLQAIGINVIKDPNYETLRWVEVADLYSQYYTKPNLDWTDDKSLLSASIGGKKGLVSTENMPIEECKSSRKISTFASVVFIELRLNCLPYSALKIDQVVQVCDDSHRRIEKIEKYKTLEAALRRIPLSWLRPPIDSVERGIEHFTQYFDDTDVQSCGGILAIWFDEVSENSFKDPTSNSEEAIINTASTKVSEELANASAGKTELELVELFKDSFSPAQLTAALNQLQIDGQVYTVGDKYFPL